MVLDRTGRYLAVANYSGGNFALFPVGDDGRLQPATSVVAGDRSGDPGWRPRDRGQVKRAETAR
ncbi:MAG: beta-propeller fold lactonase family protein [Acidobacteria bacterium]|nr:beta-propeller fold lactonase family protein [Acidobacteriota bacterium]MBI3264993.1 beta-propeller fold lactonase family protein [Acidobacteriota bacterium]